MVTSLSRTGSVRIYRFTAWTCIFQSSTLATTMSSKSNPNLRDARRRQPPGRGKALTRSTSLLGSIGRFVAAPINWLIRPDSVEFEDDTDPAGKRRRTVAPAAGQAVERGDGPAPNKRMRVRSPDRQQEPHHSGVVNAYLDPPDVVFRRQSHHNDTLNTSSNHFNHSAPAIQNIVPEFNFNFGRNTTSPMRHPITRTMSTDPPQALQSRTAARDISRKWVPRLNTVDQDVIMEAASQPSLSDTRDLSMPPLSARPSFRMRTSMTPQPIRDASEPPSLSSLREKPVFVRPPVQEPQRKSSIQPVTTLGKLVDSHRSVRSLSIAFQGTSFTFICRHILLCVSIALLSSLSPSMRRRVCAPYSLPASPS